MKNHRRQSTSFRRVRMLTVAASVATVLGTLLFISDGQARGRAAALAVGGGYTARALAAEGDADLAAHHPGRAIVDYERARLLAPRSSAIASALSQARVSVGLPAREDGRLAAALHVFSPNEWSGIALGGLGLAALAVVVGGFASRLRRPALGGFVFGAAVAALSTFAAVGAAPSDRAAVVVASDVVARIAPFAAAEPAFVAAEGSCVTIERTRAGYTWIRSAAGEGWVPSDQIETVVPTSPTWRSAS